MTPTSDPVIPPGTDPLQRDEAELVSPSVVDESLKAAPEIPKPEESKCGPLKIDGASVEQTSPVQEWLAAVFKPMLEVKHYWSDRRLINTDPTILRDPRKRLCSRAYSFAFNGVLLPSIALAFAYAAVADVYDLPKTQIEQEIDAETTFQKALEEMVQKYHLDVKKEPAWIHSMSTQQIKDEEKRLAPVIEELERKPVLSPAEKDVVNRYIQLLPIPTQRQYTQQQKKIADDKIDSAQNLELDLALKKFSAVLDRWREPITGAALILNAYLFSWWIRKLRPPLTFGGPVTEAHLYTLGVALFFPGIVGGIVGVVLDLSIRYRLERQTRIAEVMLIAVGIWALVELFRGGQRLQRVLDQEPERRRVGRVTWRLLASQLIVTFSVQLAILIVSIPAISLLLKHS
jgi:hypothetical protein